METNYPPNPVFLYGQYTVATLPAAADSINHMAYCSDLGDYMMCNGTGWYALVGKRIETYNGVSDASGNYTVVFPVAFDAIPHVNPVLYPAADSDTRARVLSVSVSGFTIRTEKNLSLTVLSLSVLGFGTAPVTGVPVRVLVVQS